jgi:glyoxylase-like metal-dependent hydrolase (beta-lactamase superfamily II)
LIFYKKKLMTDYSTRILLNLNQFIMETNFSVCRRKFLKSTGILTVGIALTPQLLLSQRENLLLSTIQESPVITIMRAAATAQIIPTKLRGNITILEGSGGNISLLDGPDGILMIDAGIGVSKPNVLAAIKSVSKKPLKYLINTHWHFDHADGNLWIKKEGATIIAQENTRKHLATTTRVDDWDYTFPPAPVAALPSKTFKDNKTINFNGEKIQMKHYLPSHTDSDISVYFPKADILVVADTWWNGYYPFIDYNTGGSITGMIKAASENVARVTNKTIIVPGHGPVGNKQQLTEFRDMLVDIHRKILTLKKQGKTLDEVVASKPTSDYDAKWGGFVIKGNVFTHLVYKGIV